MVATNWAVWIWEDELGEVRYVGVGPFNADGHPAKARWARRFDDSCPLNIWLRCFQEEPKRVVCGSAVVDRRLARALAGVYRVRHEKTILSGRPHAGGGHSRQVLHLPVDDLASATVFKSTREAAKAAGVNASTVSRWCRNRKRQDWNFLAESV